MDNIEAIREELRNLRRKKLIDGWRDISLVDDVGTYESEQLAEEFGVRWTVVRDGKSLPPLTTEQVIRFISQFWSKELDEAL